MHSLLAHWHRILWADYSVPQKWWLKQLIRLARIFYCVSRDLSAGQITLRAMSLVYTTLLSFVPLLAVSFSVLKGFGVHNQIEPLLLNLLQPLGDKSSEITRNIVGFVENMKIGVLGALGLGMLLYTVISLIQKIESAFNFTWRLDTARNLSQRFSSYLSVIMVGPVLIFSALGITASLKIQPLLSSLQSMPGTAEMILLAGELLPYVLIIAAFSFAYMLVPNTRVHPLSALYGALIAGIIWRWTGLVFASFAADSTSYTAIYSSFAILILFMIWLYLGWLILLIGASIAYYHQHPESLQEKAEQQQCNATIQETLALQLMLEIGRAFYTPCAVEPTILNLSRKLGVPHTMIKPVLNDLQKHGLIVELADLENGYHPGRSLDCITITDILRVIRHIEPGISGGQLQSTATICALQQDIERCIQQVVAGKTLKDLVISATQEE